LFVCTTIFFIYRRAKERKKNIDIKKVGVTDKVAKLLSLDSYPIKNAFFFIEEDIRTILFFEETSCQQVIE
jgi:hypothetical protein